MAPPSLYGPLEPAIPCPLPTLTSARDPASMKTPKLHSCPYVSWEATLSPLPSVVRVMVGAGRLSTGVVSGRPGHTGSTSWGPSGGCRASVTQFNAANTVLESSGRPSGLFTNEPAAWRAPPCFQGQSKSGRLGWWGKVNPPGPLAAWLALWQPRGLLRTPWP